MCSRLLAGSNRVDVNRLYFDHQIALMCASRAPDRASRTCFRARAGELARDIWQIHRASAAAAVHWRPGSAKPDGSVFADRDLPVALS
jgi:hypothetical protein